MIMYLRLGRYGYISEYDVVFCKEDIPRKIKFAKDNFRAYNFLIFELGEEVTKEFKEFIDNKE